jgi:hypothetical protein
VVNNCENTRLNTEYICRKLPQRSKRVLTETVSDGDPDKRLSNQTVSVVASPTKKRREGTNVSKVHTSRSGRHIVQTTKALDSL